MGVKFLWEQCRGGSGVVSSVCLCQMKEKDYLTCFLHYRILNWLCGLDLRWVDSP